MLEIVNQLDGFDARGNIKVLMAANRPDTLDPALLRPTRLDRKVEFGSPDLESRTQILRIHTDPWQSSAISGSNSPRASAPTPRAWSCTQCALVRSVRHPT